MKHLKKINEEFEYPNNVHDIISDMEDALVNRINLLKKVQQERNSFLREFNKLINTFEDLESNWFLNVYNRVIIDLNRDLTEKEKEEINNFVDSNSTNHNILVTTGFKQIIITFN